MSLSQHKLKTKDESPVPPDSTTVDRLVFHVGEDVLLHEENRLFVFGTVVQVEVFEEKCLIEFGDDTEKWGHFRDLRKIRVDLDISCILCKSIQSTPDNQILMCHSCKRGYHQNCHEPAIPSEFTNGEVHYMCMKCVEKRESPGKKKSAISKPVVNNNNDKSLNSVCKRRSFSYDVENLRWDANHQKNAEEKYCYCGKTGEWFRRMLQCCKCLQWFHSECIPILKQPLLNGDRFFLFLCSVCNDGREERLQRLSEEITLTDIAHIALFNLTLETAAKYHDLDESVLPFMETNWKYFQPTGELMTLSRTERRNKILATFWQFKNRFMCGRELKKKKTMWGLRTQLPPSFPTALTPQSQHTLQLWSKRDSVSMSTSVESILSNSPAMKNQVENNKKKRPHATIAERKNMVEGNARKRARTSADPELQRNLRVRQHRATSEESICEESSDDVKLLAVHGKNQNKRKRTNGGEENTSSVSSFSASLATPVETSSDETSSKGTLDMFIPPPKNFDGLNNPFCNLSSQSPGYSRNAGYLCVRPLKTRLSEKDIRITKNGEIKRKRFVRKWKQSSQADIASTLFRTDSSFRFTSPQTNSYQSPTKETVLSYFGVEERVSRGEHYTVLARRVLSKGHEQYLIQWDNDI